jgi:hypothetical protein
MAIATSTHDNSTHHMKLPLLQRPKNWNINLFAILIMLTPHPKIEDIVRYESNHRITDKHKAFRLFINNDHGDELLDSPNWPDSVVVSEWFFKSQQPAKRSRDASDDERLRVILIVTTESSTDNDNNESLFDSECIDDMHADIMNDSKLCSTIAVYAVKAISSSACHKSKIVSKKATSYLAR